MELIESIRRLVIEGHYEITVHARERMAERGVSTETSRRIDEIMEKYRAGKLEVKPISAGEIDLKQSA